MASTATFKPIDPTRDEFRRYLERAGVIEALTKIVIRLVKERPDKPLEYLRTNLCDAKHQADEVAYLQKELVEARCEIKRLRELIEAAKPEALEENIPASDEKEKKLQELSVSNQDSFKEANDSNLEHERIEETSPDIDTKVESVKHN